MFNSNGNDKNYENDANNHYNDSVSNNKIDDADNEDGNNIKMTNNNSALNNGDDDDNENDISMNNNNDDGCNANNTSDNKDDDNNSNANNSSDNNNDFFNMSNKNALQNFAFDESNHVSYSFSFFLHGASRVCTSVDIKIHKPIRLINKFDLIQLRNNMKKFFQFKSIYDKSKGSKNQSFSSKPNKKRIKGCFKGNIGVK